MTTTITLTPAVVPTRRGPIEVARVGARGTLPAVLAVHGMPGDYRQAQTIAEDLAATTEVLLVSRPGYGRTPLSSGRTAQDQADLYAALLDKLGIATVAVIGISGGGPSSYAFAERHPDRCTGLLLSCAVAAGLHRPPPAMRRLAAVPGLWPALAAATRARARRKPTALPEPETATERKLLTDPAVAAARLRFLAESPSSLSGTGLRNDVQRLDEAFSAGPRPWPAGNTVPTVVLHGDADEVVPLVHAQEHVRRILGARLEVLPGIGHGVPLFARDRVAEVLRELVGSS